MPVMNSNSAVEYNEAKRNQVTGVAEVRTFFVEEYLDNGRKTWSLYMSFGKDAKGRPNVTLFATEDQIKSQLQGARPVSVNAIREYIARESGEVTVPDNLPQSLVSMGEEDAPVVQEKVVVTPSLPPSTEGSSLDDLMGVQR